MSYRLASIKKGDGAGTYCCTPRKQLPSTMKALPVALSEGVLRSGTLAPEVVDFVLHMLVDSLNVLDRQSQ